jgi:hypothetical protein
MKGKGREHSESTLPLWAQERMNELRLGKQIAERKLQAMGESHAVLHEREWFTIQGPPERDRYTNLWFLSNEGAHSACSLGSGDVLLVGRAQAPR